MIKNHLKPTLKLLLVLAVPLFLTQSCSKDQEAENVEITTPESDLSAEKLARIQTFLKIAFGTPENELKYDEVTQIFTFGDKGQYKETRANIESWYDNANEYKLKYEN